MKKRNLLAAFLCSVCLVAGGTVPAMADTSKIVTLGADLTQDQMNTMMKYFNTSSDQVQIIYVTNADEVKYLGNYISRAQIGTRTLSCAYVKPTNSGGIKVRTANLNYVTCNMIASALSTAGVTNCEVVAACPYEVSGTGALTGVMMAYETSTGTTLDETKKDLATKEVVVTGNVGTLVGQDNATSIINQAKMQIIADNVQNADEIYNIVNNIAVQNGVSLSSDDMNTIVSLLQQIAQQSYDIEAMKETLADIQQNLEDSIAAQSGATTTDETAATPTPTTAAETADDASDTSDDDSDDGDDITQNVNIGALETESGPVIEGSTEDPDVAVNSGNQTNTASADNTEDTEGTTDTNGTGIPEATSDGTYEDGSTDTSSDQNTEDSINQDTIADENGDTGNSDEAASSADSGDTADTGIPEATTDDTYGEGNTDTTDGTTEDTTVSAEGTLEGTAETAEGTTEETTDTAEGETTEEAGTSYDVSSFSADAQTRFDNVQKFTEAAYTGDLIQTQSLMQELMSAMPQITYLPTLDSDTADKLANDVEEAYYTILQQENDGSFYYEADGTETYAMDETNAINKELKTIFGMENDPVEGDTLYNVSADDRTALYNATIEFFAGLNSEDSSLFGTDAAAEEAVAEVPEDESLDEAYTEEETY